MVKPALSFTPLLLILCLHSAVSFADDDQNTIWRHDCDNVNGNYTSSSAYSKNLDSVLTKMTTTDFSLGFSNSSAGEADDVVNLISLCIGNLPVEGCHTCQTFIKGQISGLCPNQKTAIFWSDNCMLRYSHDSIFAKMEEFPPFNMPRGLTIDSSDENKYNKVVASLVGSLPSNASAGNFSLKFATGQAQYNSSITIYSAAQCTPDLTQNDCLQCLNSAVTELKSRNSGQRGARFLFPSCFVRYEESKFYLSSSDGPPTSTSPQTTTNDGR